MLRGSRRAWSFKKGGKPSRCSLFRKLDRIREAVGVFRSGRRTVEERRCPMFALTPWRVTEKMGPPLPTLRNDFVAVFDRLLNRWPELLEPPVEPGRFWNLEMTDNEKEVMVRAEVPGFEA